MESCLIGTHTKSSYIYNSQNKTKQNTKKKKTFNIILGQSELKSTNEVDMNFCVV